LGLGLDDEGRRIPPGRTTVRLPARRRSLVALLKATPRTSGWCRPRWSGATLALTVQAQRGMTVSAETRRRWLHEIGWVWKRAKLPDLVADVEAHLHVHGPWPCTLSKIDYEPAVTAAVEKIAAEEHTRVAA
jgi:hypothetical protein